MTRPYRGILFDLDGTLVDTIELILASFRHAMAKHLGRVPPDEEWLATLGQPLRIQLLRFARSAEELERMFRTYLEHNEANHRKLVRPFPGMRETIDNLHRAGYRLAVVTSKIRHNTDRELLAAGLRDYFDVTVTADDVEAPKPDPQPVLLAAERLGLGTDEVLMVGDSVFDIRSARSARVDSAAALWGPFSRDQLAAEKPDHWLETASSLLELLLKEEETADGR